MSDETKNVNTIISIEEQEENEREALKRQKQLKRKVLARNVLIIVLIVIIIILLLRSCAAGTEDAGLQTPIQTQKEEIEKPTIQTGDLIQQEPEVTEAPQEGRIKIPVIQDFTVSSERPYGTLFSPEGNKDKYLLQYEFVNADTNEVIYSSDWLEGGFSYSVDFYSCFEEAGKYNAVVTVSTKDATTYEDKNGAVIPLVITVNE